MQRLIAVKDIDWYMKHTECIFVDLRTATAYGDGHIRGALNLPYDLFESYADKLSKNRIYILYCEHGGSSMAAGRALAAAGLEVLSVVGDISMYSGQFFV